MQPIGPFTLVLGTIQPLDLGPGTTSTNVGAVVLANLSGYEVLVRFGSAGSAGGWLVAHTADLFYPPTGWDGIITATAQNIASNSAQAPSFVIVGNVYQPGERIAGTYPVALARLSNVGNQVSTTSSNTLINDNNSAGSQIIESTPTGQGQSSWAMNNDASGFLQVLSANVLRKVWNIVRGNTGTGKASIQIGDSGDPSITTMYGNLDKLRSDAGALNSDGNGNVTTTGFYASNGPAATSYYQVNILSTTNDPNACLDITDNTSGANRWQVGKQSHANGDAWRVVDATHGIASLAIKPNHGPFIVDGQIEDAGGTPYARMSTKGGGASGFLTWEGTTDPAASATEGDLWVDA